MNKEALKIILTDQLNQFAQADDIFLPRETLFKPIVGKANVITGIRRSGKSVFLQEILRKKSKRPLILSFFDERLLDFKSNHFSMILECFSELNDGAEPDYILLDEIQLVDGWEMYASRLATNKKWMVLLTGSSAKLLSKEIASELRGRSLRYEMFPFSFSEALRFQKIDSTDKSTRNLGKINNALDQYLNWGGFPEVQSLDDGLKRRILNEYLEVLLFRDLIERNDFHKVSIARRLFVSLMRQYGNKFSLNQMLKKLQTEGMSVDKEAVSDFLRWMEDAYILFPIRLHTPSEHIARVNPVKIYLNDLGMSQAIESSTESNRGRRFENLVFSELRQRPDFKSLTYFKTKSGFEVDFVFESLDHKKQMIQVAWDLNADSKDRELLALEQAMSELNIKNSTLITAAQTDLISVSSGKIKVVKFSDFATR